MEPFISEQNYAALIKLVFIVHMCEKKKEDTFCVRESERKNKEYIQRTLRLFK